MITFTIRASWRVNSNRFNACQLACCFSTTPEVTITFFPTVPGPVVRKAVSANQGLRVKLGFYFSCITAYIRANVFWGFILVKGKTEGNKIETVKRSEKL